MKRKQTCINLLLCLVISLTLLPAVASFADTTTYEYDNINRKITIRRGTPGASPPRIVVFPGSHDFGDVQIGATSAAQIFTVSNEGGGTLTIGAITITGPNASEFNRSNDNCSNQNKAPGTSCTLQVTFSPTSGGNKTANLRIPSNDPATPELFVLLSGTGACPLVRIVGKGPYSSLQAAYNAAVDGDVIQSVAGTLTEYVVSINKNISVTLQGGFDCSYTTNSGNVTNLKGMLQTFPGGGRLTISNFNLVK